MDYSTLHLTFGAKFTVIELCKILCKNESSITSQRDWFDFSKTIESINKYISLFDSRDRSRVDIRDRTRNEIEGETYEEAIERDGLEQTFDFIDFSGLKIIRNPRPEVAEGYFLYTLGLTLETFPFVTSSEITNAIAKCMTYKPDESVLQSCRDKFVSLGINEIPEISAFADSS
jgi:hypothetical protein